MKRKFILKQTLIRLVLLPSAEAAVGSITGSVSKAGSVPPLTGLTVCREDSGGQQPCRHTYVSADRRLLLYVWVCEQTLP